MIALPCLADLTTNGLVLHMDASDNGSSPELYWEPIVGPSDGGYVCGLRTADKPTLTYPTLLTFCK